jgi:hypothetical protein
VQDFFLVDKNVLKLDSGNSCITVNLLKVIGMYILNGWIDELYLNKVGEKKRLTKGTPHLHACFYFRSLSSLGKISHVLLMIFLLLNYTLQKSELDLNKAVI